MQKHTFLLFVSVILMFVACQKPAKKFKTSQYDPNAKNFAFLKESLKDVKILALGESSRGFADLHGLKSNMIQYLHKEMDFDVLILEAGYADVGAAWNYREKSDAKQLAIGMLPPVLRTEQIKPLFEYLISQSETEDSLVVRGMDTRTASVAFIFKLMNVIKRLEPKVIQDSIQNGLTYFNKTLETVDNQVEWQKNMDRYLDAVALAKSILVDSREDIIELELASLSDIDILTRHLELLEESTNYNFGETYTRGLALRDSLMAVNVIEIVEKEFPKKKVIIWAHNGHIERSPAEGDNIKWLGHYLNERYGDKYYAMGMYVKKGYIYQTTERKSSNFDIATPTFIEGKIDRDYGKNVFVDIPSYDAENTNWVNQPINGYELEAGGQVNFIPAKRFDGVMLLGETEAPKFLSTERKRGE